MSKSRDELTVLKSTVNRRRFLKGLSSAAMSLPLLRLLEGRSEAATEDEAPPRRLVLIFSSNGFGSPAGNDRDTYHWRVEGSGADDGLTNDLPPLVEPLRPFKDRLLMCGDVHLNWGALQTNFRSGAHDMGVSTLWTNAVHAGAGGHFPTGKSLDHAVAEHLGCTPLTLGKGTGETPKIGTRMSYKGPEWPDQPLEDPQSIFEKLFGDMLLSPEERKRKRWNRREIFDAVLGDLREVQKNADGSNRERIDEHVTSVEQLRESLDDRERRCALPDQEAIAEAARMQGEERLPAHSKALIDMMVAAFRCDLTRVGSLQYGRGGSYMTHEFLKANGQRVGYPGVEGNGAGGVDDATGEWTFHDLSHQMHNSQIWPHYQATVQWYAEQVAYLLEQLESTEEPLADDGSSMLDHTLVLWGSETAHPGSHSGLGIPLMLAGNIPDGTGSPTFNTGRYVRLRKTGLVDGRKGYSNHGNILGTVARSFGLDQTGFGLPKTSDVDLTPVLGG